MHRRRAEGHQHSPEAMSPSGDALVGSPKRLLNQSWELNEQPNEVPLLGVLRQLIKSTFSCLRL